MNGRNRIHTTWATALALGVLGGCVGSAVNEPAAVKGEASPGPAAAGPVTTTQNPKEARWQDAIRGLDFETGRVIVLTPAARVNVLRARRTYREGLEALVVRHDYVGAIGLFRDALEDDPNFGEVYEPLGDALRGKGRSAWTVAAYRTAIEAGFDSADLRSKLAMQLWGMDQFDDAVAEMTMASEIEPARAETHERLAVWSYYLGDDAAAWRHVHAARARGGDVPPQFIPLLERRIPDPGG